GGARLREALGGVFLDMPFPAGPAKEGAQRGQVSRKGAVGQLATVKRGEMRSNGERIHFRERRLRRRQVGELFRPETQEALEIAPVGLDRPRGEAALVAQIGQKPVD